jgi:uncharacterized protein (TIGR03067 family)
MRTVGPAALFALFFVLLVVPANGDGPREVDRLIQQLGSLEFTEREAASQRLEAMGMQALDALLDAVVSSPDPEIRRRAKALLQPLEHLESASLLGAWVLVSAEQGGKPIHAGQFHPPREIRITDRDGELEMPLWGRRWFCEIQLRGKPKEIILMPCLTVTKPGQPTRGEPQLGIYEKSANELTICFAAVGQERPTTFTTQAGSDALLLVLKRKT